MKTCWVSRGKRGKRNRCEGYNPNTCVGRRCTLGKEFIEKHGCLTYTKCANASLTPDTPIKNISSHEKMLNEEKCGYRVGDSCGCPGNKEGAVSWSEPRGDTSWGNACAKEGYYCDCGRYWNTTKHLEKRGMKEAALRRITKKVLNEETSLLLERCNFRCHLENCREEKRIEANNDWRCGEDIGLPKCTHEKGSACDKFIKKYT